MKKTNSSDVDFVETTVQNLSHFPQYITVFITRVTGLPLFTERDLVQYPYSTGYGFRLQ